MTTLVIGEALIDVTEDRRVDPPTFAEYVGGSPANVALGLGRLGEDVELLTWIAPDERGNRIAEHLAESGVRLRRESWGAERTSVADAVIGGQPGVPPSRAAIEYTFDLEWAVAPEATPGEPRIVHTGSIASYLQPGSNGVLRLLDAARESGALITYDPNIRNTLIESPDEVRARVLEVIARADVVKLSDDDADWLYSGGVEEALRSLLKLGPRIVVVTAGAGGSITATPAGWITLPADRAQVVVDTIGAGDSYMAALIAELRHRVIAQEKDLGSLGFADLAAVGTRCARAAAITVSRPGADPPTLAEVLSAEIGA